MNDLLNAPKITQSSCLRCTWFGTRHMEPVCRWNNQDLDSMFAGRIMISCEHLNMADHGDDY